MDWTMALAEPPPRSVIGAATAWVDDLAFGSLAGTIAVIAIASLGLLLLAGRVDLRRAGAVVLGCFLIFGSAALGAVLTQRWGPTDTGAAREQVVTSSPLPPVQSPPPSADPYAGATVR